MWCILKEKNEARARGQGEKKLCRLAKNGQVSPGIGVDGVVYLWEQKREKSRFHPGYSESFLATAAHVR